MLNSRSPPIGTAAIIFIIAFLSFQYNLLWVTNSSNFNALQRESGYILDGILYAEKTPNTPLHLGKYLRPRDAGHAKDPISLFNANNTDGEFIKYKSQFGLQLYLFKFLHSTAGFSAELMESTNSAILSLIIAAFFVLVARQFGTVSAWCFCSALFLSPWVLVFARNLFWMMWTWFLPMLITFAYGEKCFASRRRKAQLATLIFFSVLLKFLCGYEYVTTIFLAALAPLIYYGVKQEVGIQKIIGQAFLVSLAVFFAFSAAVFIHASKLTSSGDYGVDAIMYSVKRNLHASDAQTIAAEVCEHVTPEARAADCRNSFVSSRNANTFAIVGRYFIIRDLLPWLGNFTQRLSDHFREDLKVTIANQSVGEFATLVLTASEADRKMFWMTICNTIVFWSFLVILFIRIILGKKDLALLLLTAFIAPISWFAIAKGHSNLHTHLNYVLWYVPFMPVALCIVVNKRHDGRCRGSSDLHSTG